MEDDVDIQSVWAQEASRREVDALRSRVRQRERAKGHSGQVGCCRCAANGDLCRDCRCCGLKQPCTNCRPMMDGKCRNPRPPQADDRGLVPMAAHSNGPSDCTTVVHGSLGGADSSLAQRRGIPACPVPLLLGHEPVSGDLILSSAGRLDRSVDARSLPVADNDEMDNTRNDKQIEPFKTGADTNLPDGQEAVDPHSAVDTFAPVCSPGVYDTGSLPGGPVRGNSVPATSDLHSASRETRGHTSGDAVEVNTAMSTLRVQGSADVRTGLDLPQPEPIASSDPSFRLGDLSAAETAGAIEAAYNKCVHFRPNAFSVPSGNIGRRFITTLTSFYSCFGDGGSYEMIALKIAAVYQMLMLQKPDCDNNKYGKILERRMDQWSKGDFAELQREADTIQTSLLSSKNKHKRDSVGSSVDLARRFADYVTAGKVGKALRGLTSGDDGGVHQLDDEIDGRTVRDILKDKHPPVEPMSEDAVIGGDPPAPPHPIYFSSLGRQSIKSAALGTQGAAGPSGVDAENWRHFCASFSDASQGLCDALASCARRLASTYVHPAFLSAFTACRLIALDKQPGVRPIGIGEVARRIISKAILSVVGQAVQEAVGCIQLCAGQDCGIEAGIHAMQQAFELDDTEGILMADASNAFNRLNRQTCLRNVRHLCP